jgi:hypothetical protein
MTTITFDTLKFVQTLKESGLTEKQAEGITAAFREAHSAAELATKGDIEFVKTELQQVKNDLQRDIREMELRLTVKLGALMAAAVGLVAALVKLL